MTYLAPWRRLLNSLGELALLCALGWLLWVRFIKQVCPLMSGWFSPYALVIYGLSASLIALHPFGEAVHLRRGLRGAAGWLWWAVSLFGCASAIYLLQDGSQGWFVFLALLPAVGYLAFGVQARTAAETKRATKAPKPPLSTDAVPPDADPQDFPAETTTKDDEEAGTDG